ncbi:MAG: sulfotransferase [Thiotrichaceae bacterium]|nr:sulfotransferase [Thiotrichaceae bacterium]
MPEKISIQKRSLPLLKRLGFDGVDEAIFVLGMHRSGTSWLTGSLQQTGLFLGKHHSWNPHNRKGNRENPDVIELHESILEYNAASWDKPPQGEVVWTKDHEEMAQKIIKDTGRYGVWGVKDPRILFLLEGWKELLTDLRFIGIFRHPLSVWNSLNVRGEIEKERALEMWLLYNSRLLNEYEKKPFPLLCFDWEESILHKRFFDVCDEMGLSADRHQLDFFSAKLRHNTEISSEPLPSQVQYTYQRLPDLCWSGSQMLKKLFSKKNSPAISIVVMVYRMPEQAMKTLESLTASYQQGVSPEDYEIIVVENPSEEMLKAECVHELGDQFRYFSMESNNPSPVNAVNYGIQKARAAVIGLMIDGARLLTPGVIRTALMAYNIDKNAIVSVPGYHLGKELQQQAVDSGYNEDVEKVLLESIQWPSKGYDLFKISCLSGSCAGGFFLPVAESNCVFSPIALLNELGGCDSNFKTPGGGFVNLDLYYRLCNHPDTKLFLLPGEGTFHQYHGGVTTSKAHRNREKLMREMREEYQQLRGHVYSKPDAQAIFLGTVPTQAMPFMLHSIQKALN